MPENEFNELLNGRDWRKFGLLLRDVWNYRGRLMDEFNFQLKICLAKGKMRKNSLIATVNIF